MKIHFDVDQITAMSAQCKIEVAFVPKDKDPSTQLEAIPARYELFLGPLFLELSSEEAKSLLNGLAGATAIHRAAVDLPNDLSGRGLTVAAGHVVSRPVGVPLELRSPGSTDKEN